MMAAGGSIPGSDFSLRRRGAWFFGAGPGGTVEREISTVVCLVGFAILVLAWLDLVRYLRTHRGTPTRRLVGVAAAWFTPFLVVAPMFSADIYFYATEGRLVVSGLDPARVGPAALSSAAYRHLVSSVWLRTPSPYGPLDLALNGAASWMGRTPLGTVIALRVSALIGVSAAAAAIPTVARSYGADPSTALALALLSPLALFELVSAGHNDAIMLGLMLVALALARRGHPFLGVVVAGVGAAVKAPDLLAVGFIGWTWPGPSSSPMRRVQTTAISIATGLAILAAAGAVSGFGFGWVANAVTQPGRIWSWLTPTDLAALAISSIGHWLSFFRALALVRLIGAGLACAACGYFVLRAERLRLPVALGGAFFAVAVLSPALHPWYLLWGIACLAMVVERRQVAAVAVGSAIAAWMWLPDDGSLSVVLLRAALVFAVWVLWCAMASRADVGGSGREVVVGGADQAWR